MSKSMLVNVTAEEEHRVAILDNGVLDIFEIETLSREHLKGDIFKAVVEGVNSALEAAFVNYGGERAGFLPLDEVNFKIYPSRGASTGGKGRGARITRHLEKGMEVLVQVIRDSYASKPPTLSTYYSLPGRYLVLMPGADAAGISRKIEDEEHRDRLRKVLSELTIPEDFGVIVRTAGMETLSSELQADLDALVELWRTIEKAGQQVKPPALIYQERDLVIRTIRDYFTSDIEEVLIDDEATFDRSLKFFQTHMPDKVDRVKHYTGDRPIFSKFNLEEQIERIYKRVVQLKSGGSICIDQTEALTAVDVNSARSVRSASSEDTATRTNLEAAEETARQLRLRDIGGLIVIDFIDMESSRHTRQVERAFSEAMARDKARYDVTRISKLGLMEVSRQRIKATKASSSFMPCPTCSGDGTVWTAEAAARVAFRKIQARVARGGVASVQVFLPNEVAIHLLNHKRDDLNRLEARHKVWIEVVPEARLKPHQFEIEEARTEEPGIVPIVSADDVEQTLASAAAHTPSTPTAAPEAARPDKKKRRRRRRRRNGGAEERGVGPELGLADGSHAVRGETSAAGIDGGSGDPIVDDNEPIFSEGPDSARSEAGAEAANDVAAADEQGVIMPRVVDLPPGTAVPSDGRRRRRRRRRGGRGGRRPQGNLAAAPGGREPGSGRQLSPGAPTGGNPAGPIEDRFEAKPASAPADRYWSEPRGPETYPGARRAEAASSDRVIGHDASGSDEQAGTTEIDTGKKPRRRWWRRSEKG